MNTRLLAATLAGGITMFITGFLIYGLALDSYMKANTIQYAGLTKDPPEWIPLIISNLVWGFLFAHIFDKWAGIRTFLGGATAGAFIFLLVGLAIDLQFVAMMKWYSGYLPVIVDVVAFTIMGAITGGVVGQILGMMGKQTQAD
jgi:hypothetical protein